MVQARRIQERVIEDGRGKQRNESLACRPKKYKEYFKINETVPEKQRLEGPALMRELKRGTSCARFSVLKKVC